jgi:predicted HAD superfamily Cof-like phosphohydrolase
MTPLEMVREFHRLYGMPVKPEPGFPEDGRRELRWDLIHEEYLEVAEAMDNYDLSNYAKELADLVYVVYGAAIEHGIDLDAVFEEVHKSNMSKVYPDGSVHFREDGKVLKGPHYRPPDIDAVLNSKDSEGPHLAFDVDNPGGRVV